MKIWSKFSRSPVTMLLLIGLAMVFGGTHFTNAEDPRSIGESMRAWGCLTELAWVSTYLPEREVPFEGLHGPFELWDGQWWRIPLSNLHHGDFLHLFLNCLVLASFGPLLERVWGSGRYFLFLTAAAFISFLPEVLAGEYPIGISGVCCAIYGALWGVRPRYPQIARWITDEHIAATMLTLVIMIVLTDLEVLRIANLAHFTGLAYGWLMGSAAVWLASRPWLLFWNVVLCHGLLVIPYWLAVHPEWNGRYHWYLATRGDDHRPRLIPDLVELQRAVRCDPSLAGAWLMLAEQELQGDQPLVAWEDLLNGLSHQPTDSGLWKLTRRVWRRLVVSDQRQLAIDIVEQQFGELTSNWLDQIRQIQPPPLLIAPEQPPRLPADEVAERPRRQAWEPPLDPYWWHAPPNDPERSHRIPADDPRSAREGELL